MRKLLALGIAFGLVACGGEDANTPPPQPPTPPPPVAVAPPPDPTPAPVAAAAPTPVVSQTDKELMTLKSFGAALGAHDTTALGALFTPDAVIKFAGAPDQTRDAYLGHEKDNFASFPDSKGAARRIFVKNDVAIVEWTMTGTNTGPAPMGAPSTGKTVGINGVDVMWFTPDGLVKELHRYMDVPTMMGQLGMMPPKMKTRAVAPMPDGQPDVHVSKNTPDEDKNAAGAVAVQKMFETHDAKGFAQTSSDDIVWDDMAGPAPMNGKKAMLGYFNMVTKAVPDMKMNCTTWAVDDYIIEECAMTGTNKGPLVAPDMKIAATNKPLNLHSVDVIQMKDGKAVKGYSYGNGMEMASQLGLMKDHKPGAKADAAKKDTTAKAPTK
jgi:ketosteroid isomerase-like protein